MRFREKSAFAVILFMLFSMGCATSGQVKVPKAARFSPDMDFTRIGTVAVIPLFPELTEDQNFSSDFGVQLEATIKARQSQWKMIGSREVLQLINTHNLGSGYKNLQADYSMGGNYMGQVVFSPATNKFIKNLERVTGANGYVVGTYRIQERPNSTLMTLLVPATAFLPGGETRVRISLLYANGSSLQTWWSAEDSRRRITRETIEEMAASLGSYFGKGKPGHL